MNSKSMNKMLEKAIEASNNLETIKDKIRYSTSLPEMSREVSVALSNVKMALRNLGAVCEELVKNVEHLNDTHDE